MPEEVNRAPDANEQPQNPEQFQAARDTAEQQPQNPEHLQAARDTAEQKIRQAIDQYASKIPGGEQFASQAKEAAAGVLNTLERGAGNRLGGVVNSASGFLGGLFGKRKKEEPPPS
ncbi:hypothetical protein [Dictyobacter formicarum]|uniref:Helicase HerA-like C-terminal domain-containing protein n=1 Tax=Dictyobacter formicarum TaxID=2778368 RepID=A0ABQ3VC65_9CHLR|nr:hypothetical protein [Dictyobacter formicarum]GHO83717.1 hypothetical protein KSZ_17230 [Dictyobacter formicarum]